LLDLHNHVLYGLDDGCRTIDESRALAVLAKKAGHRGFVATPHIRAGMFDNTVPAIKIRLAETRAAVEAEGLELFLGAEYYFDETLLPRARSKELLTLGETTRFVLTELPQMQLPPRLPDLLFELRLAGYVPVIAHPERCRGVQANIKSAVEMFKQAGVLLQLDLGSLIGHYGEGAKRASSELVKAGAYHVAACDLHRPEDVAAIVEPAKRELSAQLRKRKKEMDIDLLLDANPRRIVRDAPLEEIASL
jgi:tyrosine-protein phosphatase YwqE